MALIMDSAPTKTREGVLERFRMGLEPSDRAVVDEYLADKNYGPTELMRWFRANGYEGGTKPIYEYRLKEGI